MIRQLAVCPGANREVVTELPIVKIVPTAVTLPSECRNLVLFVTGIGKRPMTSLLDRPGQVIVRDIRGRTLVENRIGLKR